MDAELASHKIALIGANGMLAQMVRQRAPQGVELHPFDLPELDITDRRQLLDLIGALQPETIINCAACTDVDGCETKQDLAMRVNGEAVGFLAEAALAVGATLVQISTDYVFDGEKKTPYVEEDPTNPQSVYGSSKRLGEDELLASGLQKYFIIRTSWLYGPGGNNFVETIIRLAKEREELGIVGDQIGSPTYTGDLARAIFNLLSLAARLRPAAPSPYGTYHFSNTGQCSWFEFAEEIVALAVQGGELLKVKDLRPIKTEEYPLPAQRPAYSVFSKLKYTSATGATVPNWKDSLVEYFQGR
jgi:dTDP-4-dehydrorhamnose reductase